MFTKALQLSFLFFLLWCCFSYRGNLSGDEVQKPDKSDNLILPIPAGEFSISSLAALQKDVSVHLEHKRHMSMLIWKELRQCQARGTLNDAKFTGPATTGSLPSLSFEEERLMVMAGLIRAEECIQLLLNRITFSQLFDSQTGAPLSALSSGLGQHQDQVLIAYHSLIEIGVASARAARDRVAYEDNAYTRLMMTNLMREIMGDPTTQKWLEHLRSRLDDAVRIQYIDELLERIKSGRSNANIEDR